jgi:CHRD domain
MTKRTLLVAVAAGVLGSVAVADATSERNFATHLTGAEENPARDTPAQGQAKLQLSRDGDSLLCKLNVANIENVVAAHIHLGQPEDNGPVVAFLYGNEPAGGGSIQGRIATPTVTADDLVGPLAGDSMDDLMEAIRTGNAYVNVHTNDGVDPPNTGPGDFPGGEIRGQLP